VVDEGEGEPAGEGPKAVEEATGVALSRGEDVPGDLGDRGAPLGVPPAGLPGVVRALAGLGDEGLGMRLLRRMELWLTPG